MKEARPLLVPYLLMQPSRFFHGPRQNFRVMLLIALCVSPLFASSSQLERFQSLMSAGNHAAALEVAEKLTKLRPSDGYSW
jgi:hypothetical protein